MAIVRAGCGQAQRYGQSLKGEVRFKGRWWKVLLGGALLFFFGLPLLLDGFQALSPQSLLDPVRYTQQLTLSEKDWQALETKLLNFVAAPSSGLVLSSLELNWLVAFYQSELGLNGRLLFDLERDDELAAFVSLEEPPRLFLRNVYLNLRATFSLTTDDEGKKHLIASDLDLVNRNLPRTLLSGYSYLIQHLHGDLLARAPPLPPLLERVLAAVQTYEVRSGALYINSKHPLTLEEERLGLPRRTALPVEAPLEEDVDLSRPALEDMKLQQGYQY